MALLLFHRSFCEVDTEAPEHEAEEEADPARQAQDQPGVEWDDDAGAPQGAADQVQPRPRGAEPG